MNRALREFRIRGVATNLAFLENVIGHPKFRDASYTTRFIDETPELFEAVKRRDRATKLLTYIADVTVNGHPDTRDRATAAEGRPGGPAAALRQAAGGRHEAASRRRRGRTPSPAGCAASSACSSPTRRCATRTSRCSPPACGATTSSPSPGPIPGAARPAVARMLGRRDLRRRHALPHRGSLGAPRRHPRAGPEHPPADAAPRLQRRRLRQLSRQCRALFRPAGGGCRHRSLPGVRLPELGREHARLDGRGARSRQALRGRDLLHRRHPRSRTAPNTASNIMSGWRTSWKRPAPTSSASRTWPACCKPAAARKLVATLRKETDLPIHFHTHDTSGISAASVIAAVEAGVDAVDAAMDSLSGLTSQPYSRLAGRGARAAPTATPASTARRSARSRSISRRCATSTAPSNRTSASAPRRSISTRCRAASSPTSRNRRARSASRRAGTRSPGPMPTSTCCSATSSR